MGPAQCYARKQDVASRPWQWCRPQRDQEKVKNRSRLPQKGSRYPGVATRGKFRASDCGRFEEVAHRPYCFCQHHHPTAVINPERQKKFLKMLLICFPFIYFLSSCP